jgi:hypothetical protein
MHKEMRKRTRVSGNFNVTILIHETMIEVQTHNISLTGVLCSYNPLFKKDEPCKVIIALNEDFKISIDGKILRIGQQETVISFISMDEESFFHLKKLIQYNAGDAEHIDEELRKPAFIGTS